MFHIMRAKLHLGFSAGGYPGQVPAALALVAHIEQAVGEICCTFLGPGHSLDRYLARRAGHAYIRVPACPAPQSAFEAIRFVTDNVAGYCTARWQLAEQQVSLLVAVAGYASATVVRAAQSRGIPTILLEPNAVPCRTTRRLAKSATAVCGGFPQLKSQLPDGTNLHLTGNPLPLSFAAVADPLPAGLAHAPRLLVLGGKAGARIFNEVLPEAMGRIRDRLRGWQIVHQAGDTQVTTVQERYQQAGVEALVLGQIDDRAQLLRQSDLVVCRGGGFVLAELAAVGTAALVIPNPDAPDDHQTGNAKPLEEAGAVCLVDEDAAGDRLAVEVALQLEALAGDPSRRQQMAREMSNFAQPDAALQIAKLVQGTLGNNSRAAA